MSEHERWNEDSKALRLVCSFIMSRILKVCGQGTAIMILVRIFTYLEIRWAWDSKLIVKVDLSFVCLKYSYVNCWNRKCCPEQPNHLADVYQVCPEVQFYISELLRWPPVHWPHREAAVDILVGSLCFIGCFCLPKKIFEDSLESCPGRKERNLLNPSRHKSIQVC